MAVGKSTLGPPLAAALGLPFVDLDAAIEASAGRRIATIFAEEGEAAFRALEAAAVGQLCLGPPVVVALGGGTLHQPDLLARLRARFDVVVLHVEWPVVEARLRAGADRPLAARGKALFQARAAGYRSAGRLVDITGLHPDAAVAAVLQRLESP